MADSKSLGAVTYREPTEYELGIIICYNVV
jgi:hypothetical protein